MGLYLHLVIYKGVDMNTQKYLQQALNLLIEIREEDSSGLANLTFAQTMKLARIEGLLEFLNDSEKVETNTEFGKVSISNNESVII